MSKRQRLIEFIKRLSPPSILVLKLGFFAVALQACILAIVVHDTLLTNPLYVALYYPPMVEYISVSFTLVVCGALLFNAVYYEAYPN
ncbi:MAG: hypothetical protein J6R04_07770 [Clostridia bacterium]|nr:hypothetical protein [Clostridia bacterium]